MNPVVFRSPGECSCGNCETRITQVVLISLWSNFYPSAKKENPPSVFFFFYFLCYIGVELINYVVLVSGVQQSDSVTHMHVSILFQILFPIRLLQNIEQSSLCYTVGPRWLSVVHITVCTCQFQTPNSSHQWYSD